MNTRTTASEFIDKAYENGHARGTVAEAAVALFKAYNRADLAHRRTLIGDLITLTERFAREGERWDESATTLCATLTTSARSAGIVPPTPVVPRPKTYTCGYCNATTDHLPEATYTGLALENWRCQECQEWNDVPKPTHPLPLGTRIISIEGEWDDDDGTERYTGPNAIGEVMSNNQHDGRGHVYGVLFPNGTSVFLDQFGELDQPGYQILTD